jgi:hypothetical protein
LGGIVIAMTVLVINLVVIDFFCRRDEDRNPILDSIGLGT